ncbi:4'-phosphopantetheinyl transferase family protein [Candidatus Uabimicrobium amorphum]|uniref:Phosphopantetheine-protein transferase n=1 Tax=Uabimicrobium amorphum TaxID=2596890 RepID=A0A5S9IIT8_UABAM|nr:4'-phosphopantetheinyl transferase superfamily protein [Candidatus Uabimicrobium amorphum]BBM82484.1 phosphopantetheine-protein transferase [Candidatus Uabimicrobium amorphum]
MFLPSNFWSNLPQVELQKDDTHVWYISLQASTHDLSYFSQLLNEEEKKRAAKFHFEKHRIHFTVARAVMRILLGKYLNKEAREVQFYYQERGKPYVQELIHFNISHSGDRALFAVNKNYELGVDIEFMRDNVSCEQIATRYFSQTEIIELAKTTNKKLAFFRGWSRKEAYIKAIGDGLTMPLASFYVPLMATENLSIHHNDPRTWGLWNLEVGENYTGAIVVQTLNTNIRKYTYDG